MWPCRLAAQASCFAISCHFFFFFFFVACRACTMLAACVLFPGQWLRFLVFWVRFFPSATRWDHPRVRVSSYFHFFSALPNILSSTGIVYNGRQPAAEEAPPRPEGHAPVHARRAPGLPPQPAVRCDGGGGVGVLNFIGSADVSCSPMVLSSSHPVVLSRCRFQYPNQVRPPRLLMCVCV